MKIEREDEPSARDFASRKRTEILGALGVAREAEELAKPPPPKVKAKAKAKTAVNKTAAKPTTAAKTPAKTAKKKADLT